MAKRGRPASFDRQEALERAMELFWAKGYEGTTLEDLQAAMGGLTPPSLYNAFGSKEALFKEAANLYIETVGSAPGRALEGAKTAREGIEAMLRAAAEIFTQPGRPHGCFLQGSATNCSPASRGAQDYLSSFRKSGPDVIVKRLRRAVKEGDLSAEADVRRIAGFYLTVSQGMGLRASDGATRAELMAAVEGAMAAWEVLAKPRPVKPGKIRETGPSPSAHRRT